MPTELQIIRAQEFVRLDPHNHLDFQTSKAALHVLAAACRIRGIHRAMLDLRTLPIPAKRLFKPSEMAALVETFREVGFSRQQRLAVLYRRDPFGGARLFAFIGIMRGWHVRAFSDFEKAFLWLSEEKEKPDKQSKHRGQEIPIQFREHKQTSGRLTR
jgi:hypothetical protein